MNKKIVAICLFASLILIVGLYLMFRDQLPGSQNIPRFSPSTNPSVVNQTPSSLTDKIVSVVPDSSNELVPNQNQVFVVQFSSSPPQNLDIFIEKADPQSLDNFESVLFSQSSTSNSVTLKLGEKTAPGEIYSLKLTSGNLSLLDRQYKVGFPNPSPTVQNDTRLKEFLPYQTTSFRLVYDQETNSYIFHFRYNENSAEDLETQYQKAKQEASDFIKAKGVNLDSLIIEWRYS